MRVSGGDNPLDASAVHPESYKLVETIAKKSERDVRGLIGDTSFLRGLKAQDFVTEKFGLPTITDILKELDKPGRDPRPEFKTAQFQDGVETLKDLELGMILEGTITNVTNFGAFVDVGVHQDGLVHISALSDTFVKDPHQVVKAGDIVKVKVMEIDVARKRVALTMRMSDTPGEKTSAGGGERMSKGQQRHKSSPAPQAAGGMGTMAALFAQAKNNNKKR